MTEKRCRPSANARPTEAILFNYIVSKQLSEDEADWTNRDSQGSGGPIPPVWWFSASVAGPVWQSRIGPSAFAAVQLHVATSTGPATFTGTYSAQAELHRQSDRERWQQQHHSPRPGDCRRRKRGQHGRRVGDFRLGERAAHRVGSFRPGLRRSDSGSDRS
jgi:hypothetical protein